VNLRLVRQVDDAQVTSGAPFLRLPLAPSQERRRLRLYLAMLVSDIVALLAGFLLAGYAYTGLFAERMTMLEVQLVLPLFLTIALYNGSYSFASLTDVRAAWLKAVIALLLAAALLNFVAFYLKANAHFSRATLGLGLGFGCALLLVVRLAIKAWIVACCRGGLHNILVIDDGGAPLALPGAFRVETAAHGLSADADDPAMLDLLGRITANMDRVIVSCPSGRRGRWACAPPIPCPARRARSAAQVGRRLCRGRTTGFLQQQIGRGLKHAGCHRQGAIALRQQAGTDPAIGQCEQQGGAFRPSFVAPHGPEAIPFRRKAISHGHAVKQGARAAVQSKIICAVNDKMHQHVIAFGIEQRIVIAPAAHVEFNKRPLRAGKRRQMLQQKDGIGR